MHNKNLVMAYKIGYNILITKTGAKDKKRVIEK